MSYECEICFETKSGNNVIDYGCDHKFCTECVTNYMESLIGDGLISCLKCPETECERSADETLIKKLVSEDMFDRYEKLMLKEITKDMDDIVRYYNQD